MIIEKKREKSYEVIHSKSDDKKDNHYKQDLNKQSDISMI